MPNTIRVRLVKSTIGRLESHKACARGLGFRRLNQVIEVVDSPENRGMMNEIAYLLKQEA